MDPLGCLRREAARFDRWAARQPQESRSGEWECAYPFWPPLLRACETVLDAGDPGTWDATVTALLQHVLARDNEAETLQDALVTRPAALLVLARAGSAGVEGDAGWQLAAALGWAAVPDIEAEGLLTAFLDHADEHVRRRALLALGDRRSPAAEAAALRAWDTGEEYQRIAALHVLHAVGSPLLATYRERAGVDGRRFVVSAAEHVGPG